MLNCRKIYPRPNPQDLERDLIWGKRGLLKSIIYLAVPGCSTCVKAKSVVACQASLSIEFSRQEYWNGLPCPPPGDLPDPGDRTLASLLLLFNQSVVSISVTPQTAAHQASQSFTVSQNLLKLLPIESVMPSNQLILCCPFSSCLRSF